MRSWLRRTRTSSTGSPVEFVVTGEPLDRGKIVQLSTELHGASEPDMQAALNKLYPAYVAAYQKLVAAQEGSREAEVDEANRGVIAAADDITFKFDLPSMKVLEFENALIATSQPTVIYFYTPSCGGCRFMSPLIEKTAPLYKDQVTFLKVNTFDYPDVGRHYDIFSVPTVLLTVGGKVVGRINGRTVEQVSEQIDAGMAPKPEVPETTAAETSIQTDAGPEIT